MIIDKNTTTEQFLSFAGVIDVTQALSELIERLDKPDTVCGVPVPEDLNHLVYGNLVHLQQMSSWEDFIFNPSLVIFDAHNNRLIQEKTEYLTITHHEKEKIKEELKKKNLWFERTREDLLKEKLFNVVGCSAFVKKELEQINKRFARLNKRPTSEQIRAGINKLNFGSFGIIDWYARRMGINNQAEVWCDVLWIRILECLSNDKDVSEYDQRYQKIMNEKAQQQAKAQRR